jgi:phosphoribosylamine--glycine ligase
MASEGYPGNFTKGKVITGLDRVKSMPDTKVFHAGTRNERGLTVTDGGRVLAVTALGDTFADAKANAYEAVSRIQFPGAAYRTDIADRALAPLTPAKAEPVVVASADSEAAPPS